MRMWMIPAKLLCRKHLLGEHNEIHKHRHNFVKGHSIAGRITPVVQVEPISMKKRHDELAEEMMQRCYNHKSPYEQPDLSKYPDIEKIKVNIKISVQDLSKRCPECKKLLHEFHL